MIIEAYESITENLEDKISKMRLILEIVESVYSRIWNDIIGTFFNTYYNEPDYNKPNFILEDYIEETIKDLQLIRGPLFPEDEDKKIKDVIYSLLSGEFGKDNFSECDIGATNTEFSITYEEFIELYKKGTDGNGSAIDKYRKRFEDLQEILSMGQKNLSEYQKRITKNK